MEFDADGESPQRTISQFARNQFIAFATTRERAWIARRSISTATGPIRSGQALIAIRAGVGHKDLPILLTDAIAHEFTGRGRAIGAFGDMRHGIAHRIARRAASSRDAGIAEFAWFVYDLKKHVRGFRCTIIADHHAISGTRLLERHEIAGFGAEGTSDERISRDAAQWRFTGRFGQFVRFDGARLSAAIKHTLDRNVAIAMRVFGRAVAQGIFICGTTPHADGNADAQGNRKCSPDIFHGTNHWHFLLMETLGITCRTVKNIE